MKLKNALGTYKLIFKDASTSLIVVKNQAQAKFLSNNMYNLHIREWIALEAEMNKAEMKGGAQ